MHYNIFMRITTKSTRATINFGLRLAKKAQGGQIFALKGDLGGGKTYFTKGFARGLGIKKIIISPSFLLMKIYKIKKNRVKYFCHVDAYRLKKPKEILEIGLKEYLGQKDTITVIEWADKIKNILAPYPKTVLKFIFTDKSTRTITITKTRAK